LRAFNAAKCDCGGLHPGPCCGSLQRSPRSLAGFKGPLHGGEGRGKGGKEKGEEGKGRREGDGRLTLMRSWNRAADWLRPALRIKKVFCALQTGPARHYEIHKT